ncbi:MAG: hypothetical protein ABL308_10700 [Oceanicaulis sp.]
MSRFALLPAAALAAALAACAPTQTTYGPLAGSSAGIGYDQIRIEDDRWRVSFAGGGGASRDEVERLALRRAAELALQNGYEWFEVVDRRFDAEGSDRSPVRVGGTVGRSWGSGGFGGTGVGIGVSLSPGQQRREIVSLEIIAGAGEPRPEGAYDAAAVARPIY